MSLRAADLQALLREFPHLSKSDLEEIGKELRKGVRDIPNYKLSTLFGLCTDIYPESFPRGFAVPALLPDLQRRTLVMLDAIIPVADKFDWDWMGGDFNWQYWQSLVQTYWADADASQNAQLGPTAGQGTGGTGGTAAGTGTPTAGAGGAAAGGGAPGAAAGAGAGAVSPRSPRQVRFATGTAGGAGPAGGVPAGGPAAAQTGVGGGAPAGGAPDPASLVPHEWADPIGGKPPGQDDVVPQTLVRTAYDEGHPSYVTINKQNWSIKRTHVPGQDGGTRDPFNPGGPKTAESVAVALGFRSDTMFGEKHKRCAAHVISTMFYTHSSAESYVKDRFRELTARGATVAEKEKYSSIRMSARTLDELLRHTDLTTASRQSILDDDLIEMHCFRIGGEDYVSSTGNYLGLAAVSGLEEHLLPQDIITEAANQANASAKLRNNLKGNVTTSAPAQKGGKGGGGKGAAGYVPIGQRQCYECGEYGHLGKDCPVRKARLAKEAGDGAADRPPRGRPRGNQKPKVEKDDE